MEQISTDPYSFTYSGTDESKDVLKNVDNLIAYYRHGAIKYGKRLSRYKLLGLFFSVAVTVLSGIEALHGKYSWIVTVAGAFATLFTGMLSATKAQEYYITAGSQHAKVYAEKLLYLGDASVYANEKTSEGKLRALADRVNQVYLGGEERWEGVNRPTLAPGQKSN